MKKRNSIKTATLVVTLFTSIGVSSLYSADEAQSPILNDNPQTEQKMPQENTTTDQADNKDSSQAKMHHHHDDDVQTVSADESKNIDKNECGHKPVKKTSSKYKRSFGEPKWRGPYRDGESRGRKYDNDSYGRPDFEWPDFRG